MLWISTLLAMFFALALSLPICAAQCCKVYSDPLTKTIRKHWMPPKGNESHKVLVRFAIDSSGHLLWVRLKRSSGRSICDHAAIQAVETAAPFPPLPSGAPARVTIEFLFEYNVFCGTPKRSPITVVEHVSDDPVPDCCRQHL
jgi:TonB family protein